MNCNEFNNRINMLLNNSDDSTEDLQEHARHCGHCAKQLQQARLLAQLKELPVPAYTSEFKRQAFRNASLAHSTGHHRGFFAGFSTAVAAGVALWLFTSLFFATSQDLATNTIHISLLQKQEIKLAFDTPQALSNAKVSITLPADTQIAGLPGKQQVSWHTDLKAGSNVLKLPIVALRNTGGELLAKVEHQGKIQQLRIILKVKTPGAAGLERRTILTMS